MLLRSSNVVVTVGVATVTETATVVSFFANRVPRGYLT